MTANTQARAKLADKIQHQARQYDIPQNELSVDVYTDARRQADVAKVSFRASGSMDKYGGEIAFSQAAQNAGNNIIDRQIDDLLQQLEAAWLEEGGRVTFYKGHGFFYRLKSNGPKAALEIQCTVCSHLEMVQKPTDVLKEYRDVFLMAKLPIADRECDCSHHRYDAVSTEIRSEGLLHAND